MSSVMIKEQKWSRRRMKNQSKTIIKMYHKVFRICFEHEHVSHRFGMMKKYFALIRSSFHPPIYYIFECFLFPILFQDILRCRYGFPCYSLFVQKISRVFVQNIMEIKGTNNKTIDVELWDENLTSAIENENFNDTHWSSIARGLLQRNISICPNISLKSLNFVSVCF